MNRTILMLEDDEDDRYITQTIMDDNAYNVCIKFVSNSHDLFDNLRSWHADSTPFPSLIILDYHTFPMNASQILKELKSDAALMHIPVVVLSGTGNGEIIRQCYREGASSFIRKPSTSLGTNMKISTFIKYWFETVELF